jgi:hypothetical protein
LLCPRRMTLRSRPTHLALGTALLLSLPLLSACEPPVSEPPPTQPETQTIRGQLPGYPNPDLKATVMIPGHAPVSPDAATGAFEIPNVKVPYDLVVYFPRFVGFGMVTVFKGLQRNDPTLPATYSWLHRTSVFGTISGPRFPLPTNRRLAVYFEAPFSIDNQFNESKSSYIHEPAWYGPVTLTGTLHAVELGGDPTTGARSYWSYGRREGVTLTKGTSSDGQDITLSPVGTASVTGRVVGTPGLTHEKTTISLDLVGEAGMQLFTYDPASTFQLAVPDMAGAAFRVEAFLKNTSTNESASVWKTGVRAGATDVVLTSPMPPRLLTPASGAQVAELSAGFSWEGPERALHTLTFNPSVPGEPTYHIVTTDSRATLPDVSPLGLSGPVRGRNYTWEVNSHGPVESVEAWMRSTPPPSDSRFTTQSGRSTLTLAP